MDPPRALGVVRSPSRGSRGSFRGSRGSVQEPVGGCKGPGLATAVWEKCTPGLPALGRDLVYNFPIRDTIDLGPKRDLLGMWMGRQNRGPPGRG